MHTLLCAAPSQCGPAAWNRSWLLRSRHGMYNNASTHLQNDGGFHSIGPEESPWRAASELPHA